MKRVTFLLAGTALPLILLAGAADASTRESKAPAYEAAAQPIIVAQRDDGPRGRSEERRRDGEARGQQAQAEVERAREQAEEAEARAEALAAEAAEAEARAAEAVEASVAADTAAAADEADEEADAEAEARAEAADAAEAEAAELRRRAEEAAREADEARATIEAAEAAAAEAEEAARAEEAEAAAEAEAEAARAEEAEAAAEAEAEAARAEEAEAAAEAEAEAARAEEAEAAAEAEAEAARAEEAEAAAEAEADAARAEEAEEAAEAEEPAETETAPAAERPRGEERRERARQDRGERDRPTAEAAPADEEPRAAESEEREPATATEAPAPAAETPAAETPAAETPAAETPVPAADSQQPDAEEEPERIQDVREGRRERVENGVTIIEEPGARTIIREDDQLIIRQDEGERLERIYRDVRRERRGGEDVVITPRESGVEIITVLDTEGNLLRRIRREPDGRETVLIDNTPRERTERERWGDRRDGRRDDRRGDRADDRWRDERRLRRDSGYFEYRIELAPPVIRIPREEYIVDYGRVRAPELERIFLAPPVAEVRERYTLDEVRYNPNLRDYMRRVDLDTVTFDSGSWRLSPAQIDQLGRVAEAMNAVIDENPDEIFLVEGHTDAVGRAIDNLSLSDRRAESVAYVLSEYYDVPPENLVTQGYGEEYLKVDTEAAERRNRRVTIRRITPLLATGPRG